MATRSRIGIKHGDGTITAVYCHSDGYYSWNGRHLFEYYNSLDLARQLVELGDLSSIKEEVGERHDFDWRDEPQFKPTGSAWGLDWDKVAADPRNRMTTAYGRDRGETGIEPRVYANLAELAEVFEEFLYLFDEARGEWIACETPWKATADDLIWHRLSDIAAAGYNVMEERNADYYAPDAIDRPSVIKAISYDQSYVELA